MLKTQVITWENAPIEIEPSQIDFWTPQSWRKKSPIAQAIEYDDQKAHDDVCQTISSLPPLVSTVKIEIARLHFAAAALGQAFIIQGGDCAESFQDLRPLIVQQKVKLLDEESYLLRDALKLPVVTVGRIAGQYAKPRSSPFETLPDGSKIHAFRGENINGPHISERTPDPSRLLHGYFHARATLDLIKSSRALLTPPDNDMPSTTSLHDLGPGAIFTSHEVLHLPYESAMTHGHYNTSASFVWIGERTRQLNGPHIEYIRGIRNPIGVKVGPSMQPKELVQLLDVICPRVDQDTEAGRVTLITRLGADKVETVLPPLIDAVREAGHKPVWMCDPCHGNTKATPSGIKTRSVETLLKEVLKTYDIHRQHGSFLGGLHLEQTGEAVTECVSSMDTCSEEYLSSNYRSLCDPRLSYIQALTVVRGFVDHVTQYKLKFPEA